MDEQFIGCHVFNCSSGLSDARRDVHDRPARHHRHPPAHRLAQSLRQDLPDEARPVIDTPAFRRQVRQQRRHLERGRRHTLSQLALPQPQSQRKNGHDRPTLADVFQ